MGTSLKVSPFNTVLKRVVNYNKNIKNLKNNHREIDILLINKEDSVAQNYQVKEKLHPIEDLHFFDGEYKTTIYSGIKEHKESEYDSLDYGFFKVECDEGVNFIINKLNYLMH